MPKPISSKMTMETSYYFCFDIPDIRRGQEATSSTLWSLRGKALQIKHLCQLSVTCFPGTQTHCHTGLEKPCWISSLVSLPVNFMGIRFFCVDTDCISVLLFFSFFFFITVNLLCYLRYFYASFSHLRYLVASQFPQTLNVGSGKWGFP